jgi:hypothetical protein
MEGYLALPFAAWEKEVTDAVGNEQQNAVRHYEIYNIAFRIIYVLGSVMVICGESLK